MESSSTSIHSFSTHVPFKQLIVITHYISMVIAFLGCYPLLLTQHIRRQKVYIASASLFFASIGFISGSFIQQQSETTNTASSLVLRLFALLLLFLVFVQFILLLYRSNYIIEKFPIFHSFIPVKLSKIPKWVDLVLGWFILIIATSYLTLAALVFTESCNNMNGQQSQCLMPVAMGTGFLLYGTMALLHLLAIIKLPRSSTPEYYEGVILTFWGFISLLLAGTPILGSEWRAINLGLLWFTGGLFSISLSVQTWIPALRERNIINSLIICLTGRAIVAGITQVQDTFAAQVHTMLGYILIIGAIARLIQIIFRKSPTDNLPHGMFQQNTIDTTMDNDELEDDDNEITKDNIMRQPKCRHKFIFATITLINGLLSSVLSICGGILFMGSNIGWIGYMKYYINDPTTYINITLAVSFIWSAYVFGLCTIYKTLKASNAIHQYEYLELENNVNFGQEERRVWSSPVVVTPITTNSSSAIIMMATTTLPPPPPPPPPIDYISTASPTTEIMIIPQHYSLQKESNNNIPEKTIRPSQYRAKRRSLLVQSPILNSNIRSSSNFGVGGVLPDEIIQLQKVPTPPTMDLSSLRRSWLSSGSSVSMDSSSAPNSPCFDQQRPYSSISSTLPHGIQHQQHLRRNSTNEFDIGGEDDEEDLLLHDESRRRSVHKTESGKRKERCLIMNSNSDNISDLVISNSSGSKFQRRSFQRNDNIIGGGYQSKK